MREPRVENGGSREAFHRGRTMKLAMRCVRLASFFSPSNSQLIEVATTGDDSTPM